MIYVSNLIRYRGDNRKWFHITSDTSLEELSDFVSEISARRVKFGATSSAGNHLATRGFTRYDMPYIGNNMARYKLAVEKVGGSSYLTLVKRAGRILAYSLSGDGAKALEEMAKLPADPAGDL